MRHTLNPGQQVMTGNLKDKLNNLSLRNTVIISLSAILMAAAASFTSLSISRDYYKVAPYHYDSAVYRVHALDVYDMLKENGFINALALSLSTKDSLDITLRLLLFPPALQNRYGHMLILVPFMTLFTGLCSLYVLRRTSRLSMAVLCPAVLFVYPLFYHPYWGIADYWQDNIAAWILGIAVITWLLADNLRNRFWSTLSGIMLGLIAMQRTSTAVYAGLLFAPLMIWALIKGRQNGCLRAVLLNCTAFIIPAAVAAATVLIFQAVDLYKYYVLGGYAYGTHSDIFKFILGGITNVFPKPSQIFFSGTHYGITVIPLILIPAYIVSAITSDAWKLKSDHANKSLWFVIGFPLILVAATTYYFGFFTNFAVLLTILLAALLPQKPTANLTAIITALMLTAVSAGTVLQYCRTTDNAEEISQRTGWYRTLMLALAEEVTKDSNPEQPYSSFFNEMGPPFANHARFDLKHKIKQPEIEIYFHDTHFHNNFPGMSADEIVRQEMHRLESKPKPIVFAYNDIEKQYIYNLPENPLASAVIQKLNRYVKISPQWKITSSIPSEYGLINIYRFTPPTQ